MNAQFHHHPATDKPDHALDMFMSGVLAALCVAVLSAILRHPDVLGFAKTMGTAFGGVALLGLDFFMFADSYQSWKHERSE